MDELRTAFTDEQYANPYPPGIEKHYWHQARNRILLRKLRPVLSPTDKVLDIGCGPGIVVDYLRRLGVDCAGVDLGSPVPATSDVAPFLDLGKSAFDLTPAARSSVTAILLMDMLEHLPTPEEFLRDCEAHFPNARRIFVTLPARMEIWSSYDEYYGHYRRYALDALAGLIGQTHFRLVDSGYFFHLLYVAARVVATASKTRSHRVVAPKLGFPHAVLGRLLDLEELLMPRAMHGSSLYAMFERQGR
jgi:SAM-dependent methyltransferase